MEWRQAVRVESLAWRGRRMARGSAERFMMPLWNLIYFSRCAGAFMIISMKIYTAVVLALCIMHASPTIYSLSPDFKVSNTISPQELAHASFEEKIYETGWNHLHLYANPQRGLIEQHQGVGFLEGYLEYKGIYSAYQNLCGSILQGEQLEAKAQGFVNSQLEYLEMMTANHPRDIYWQYAAAYLEQLRFMYRGYLSRINVEHSSSMYIGFSSFYYLTNVGDLQDLLPAFRNNQTTPGNCNAYVKLLNGQLYVGHSTHNIYQFLLRTLKTYSFPTRDEKVGSQWFSFSSRPGDLISKDDFYVLSSGLIVMETSFSNMNPNNYKDLSPQTVPCWLRQTIAVNLARSGEEWVDIFLKNRSGTHNNQWVIVDKNQLSQSKFKDVVVFVEEGFSLYDVIDMTPLLQQQGYVASYNVPYSKKIFTKLGYEKYPYNYDDNPRAYEYAKYDKLIQNQTDMKKWLLSNENEDPSVGIAPRYDLKTDSPSVFGLTDLKIVTPDTFKNRFFWAYSGPSTSNGRFPAFDWTNWPNQASFGMPRKWNFDWEKFTMFEEVGEQTAESGEMQILEA